MSTTRREFLKSAGYGAAAVAATTGAGRLFLGSASAATVSLGLVATDGTSRCPGARTRRTSTSSGSGASRRTS